MLYDLQHQNHIHQYQLLQQSYLFNKLEMSIKDPFLFRTQSKQSINGNDKYLQSDQDQFLSQQMSPKQSPVKYKPISQYLMSNDSFKLSNQQQQKQQQHNQEPSPQILLLVLYENYEKYKKNTLRYHKLLLLLWIIFQALVIFICSTHLNTITNYVSFNTEYLQPNPLYNQVIEQRLKQLKSNDIGRPQNTSRSLQTQEYDLNFYWYGILQLYVIMELYWLYILYRIRYLLKQINTDALQYILKMVYLPLFVACFIKDVFFYMAYWQMDTSLKNLVKVLNQQIYNIQTSILNRQSYKSILETIQQLELSIKISHFFNYTIALQYGLDIILGSLIILGIVKLYRNIMQCNNSISELEDYNFYGVEDVLKTNQDFLKQQPSHTKSQKQIQQPFILEKKSKMRKQYGENQKSKFFINKKRKSSNQNNRDELRSWKLLNKRSYDLDTPSKKQNQQNYN